VAAAEAATHDFIPDSRHHETPDIERAKPNEADMAVIRYLVDDVDAALPFYRTIGFKLADRWGAPFAIVKRKGLSVWLSGPGTSARKRLKEGSTPEPGGWNRLVVEVKDIDKTIVELKAQGARFRSGPIKGPGGRQVLVEDPSGNPIELFEPKPGE
jgi:catechol 2,3-dioxygenase-like lactoylglutathione lyase family enzyme